jgi:hypothetical protein
MLTMSKESLLKKALIKSVVTVAVVLTVVLGGGMYLSDYDDTVLAEQATKQSQNNTTSAEVKEIEATLGTQNEVAKYYDEYAKSHNTNFVIDRETIGGVLTSLRKIHHFANNLEVTVSSITDADNGMGLKSGKMVRSNVRMSFSALTDNSVYNFIYDLQHKLPGVVLISDLKITKTDELSRNIVSQAVSRHTLTPMVKGELTFMWLGIRPAPENVATPANGSK